MVRRIVFSCSKCIIVAVEQMKSFLYVLNADAVMSIVRTGVFAVLACKQNTFIYLCYAYIDKRIFTVTHSMLECISRSEMNSKGGICTRGTIIGKSVQMVSRSVYRNFISAI